MHQRCSIAVASRMTAKRTASSPLQGLRIMVKDMYEIAGYHTGLGSRAFLELSKPGRTTAPAIQRLIDLGAAIVGTGQLCAMVGKTEPTQTIDHLAPFNPRADGFQSPSGGSSGQPSAVATYDWLDIAVGSDSTASGRLPAQANGCFSLRPTHGSVSIEGMWSGVPRFDTPCLFARGIGILRDVAECWLDTSSFHSSRNSSLTAIYILTDFLPLANEQQMQVFNNFVTDLESYSGRSVQRISIEESWMNHPPAKADGLALQSYLSPTVATRTYVYSIWLRISAFRAAYLAQFDGTEPFLPAPKGIHVWDAAKDVTTQQSEEAWQCLEVYKDWLMSHVLQVNDITNDNPIVVMPLENVTTRYRDEWPAPAKGDQQLWDSLLLAPILGAPEVVIPAGVVEYSSRISGKIEELPVCVSILGMPGTDRELLSTIQRFLVAVGRPTTVKTGSRMF